VTRTAPKRSIKERSARLVLPERVSASNVLIHLGEEREKDFSAATVALANAQKTAAS